MARSRKPAPEPAIEDVAAPPAARGHGPVARALLTPARPFIALARKLGRLLSRAVRLAVLAAAVATLVTVLDALFAPSGKGRDRGE